MSGPLIPEIYMTDDYPREGCKIVVEFVNGKYIRRVYAPGFDPVGIVGLLESYAPRPIASIGIALHAFAHGRTDQQVLYEMARAEQVATDD